MAFGSPREVKIEIDDSAIEPLISRLDEATLRLSTATEFSVEVAKRLELAVKSFNEATHRAEIAAQKAVAAQRRG